MGDRSSGSGEQRRGGAYRGGLFLERLILGLVRVPPPRPSARSGRHPSSDAPEGLGAHPSSTFCKSSLAERSSFQAPARLTPPAHPATVCSLRSRQSRGGARTAALRRHGRSA